MSKNVSKKFRGCRAAELGVKLGLMNKLVLSCVLMFSCSAFGQSKMDWPFDQP